MKYILMVFLFTGVLGMSGCGARSTSMGDLTTYDGVSREHPGDAHSLAEQTARELSRRYPPGHTSLALVSAPGSFSETLEAALRRQGFAVAGPQQSADVRVAYTLDAIQGEPTCYLQVKTSDGGRFGYVRELTNEPGLPVTEPPSVAPLPVEPVLESRPLPDMPVAATTPQTSKTMPPNTVHTTGTASRIAKRNGVPVADFCRWNNVKPRETLYAGHRVWLHEPPVAIPVAAPVPPTPAAAPISPALTPVAAAAPFPPEPSDETAAPSPVAATAEPLPQEDIHQGEIPASDWNIEPGGLRAQLNAWASRAGYQLVWKAGHDYDMESHAAFQGEFPEAVKKLFSGLQRAGYALRVTLYKGNNVMEVGDK